MREQPNSSIHNTFSNKNKFTVDDVGNIGVSHYNAPFNTNELGTDVSVPTLLEAKPNVKFFTENLNYLDVYIIGSNVIRGIGQPIHIANFVK